MPMRTSNRFKIFRSLSTLAAIFLCVLALSGCGGSVDGKYTHQEKLPDGKTVKMTLELKDGKNAVMTITGGEAGASLSTEGTYKVEGDKITVTTSSGPQVFTKKDGKLVSKGFGETIELVKE